MATGRSPDAGKLDGLSSPSIARRIASLLPCGYLSLTPHAAMTTCFAAAITGSESEIEPGVLAATESTQAFVASTSSRPG